MPYQGYKVLTINDVFTDLFSDVQPSAVTTSLRRVLTDREDPAVCAIVEDAYIDQDFTASYYMQEGRAFLPLKRDSTRIHFFSEAISKLALIRAGGSTVERMQDSYLGFSVLRPGSPRTLGRTAISPPQTQGSNRLFCPPQGFIRAHLAGIPLQVSACPYLSQDQAALACATAALWMGTSVLQTKDGQNSPYTTSEITSLAMGVDRPFGPGVGRSGLQLVQMQQALSKMGYGAWAWQFPDREDLRKICYMYTESGLSPILIVYLPERDAFHAITVTGHTTVSNPIETHTIDSNTFLSSSYSKDVTFHDDQEGLYEAGEIEDAPSDPWKSQIVRSSGDMWTHGYVMAVLVPTPNRIMYDYETALAHAHEVSLTAARETGLVGNDDVVLRPLLVRSSRFKRGLLGRDDMPQVVRNLFRTLPLPRYVWLVEMAKKSDWKITSDSLPRIFGEVLIDPTVAATSEWATLGSHVPGSVLGLVDSNDSWRVIDRPAPDESTYQLFEVPSRP